MASLPAVIRAAPIAGLPLVLAASLAVADGDSAEVRAFNEALLHHDSATEVLRGWCASHHLANPPVIMARRDRGVDKPADRHVRAQLLATHGEPVRYRHVRLTCGGHVLSVADNWYRPDLLTPEMNRQLDQTDTPFGVVVRPLAFHRRTARVTLPAAAGGADRIGPYVLRHEAVLITGAGQPFSVVVESYTSEILGLSPPGR
jgi:hypothetical protein